MLFAKIENRILRGDRELQGIIVVSEDLYGAHCYGQQGYDEGLMDYHKIVGVEVSVANPASQEDLFKAGTAMGYKIDDETTPTELLGKFGVIGELKKRGFDSYRDYEVISNSQFEVTIVWQWDQLKILQDPKGVPDFTVQENDEGGLTLKVNTVAGRERIYWAIASNNGPIEQEDAMVMLEVLQGSDYVMKKAGLVSKGDKTWSLTEFYPYVFAQNGTFNLPQAEPAPALGR